MGAGGWGYFAGGLPAYAKAFSFVEVNVTFYRPVPEARARRWRAQVPPAFTFAVKGNRAVTHEGGLRADGPSREAFARDLRTASILRAPFLILQTPEALEADAPQVAGLRDLAALVPREVRLGLEARSSAGRDLPEALRNAMEDAGILDVVDLSRQPPRVASEDVYTRLFGHGRHNRYEFDDDELRAIDGAGRDAVRVAFTFHGVRMYRDAARFLTFKRTGSFPKLTESAGLDALGEVLRSGVRYPATREEILRNHGWRLVRTEGGAHVHASRALEVLPDRPFESAEAVLAAVRAVAAPGAEAPPDASRRPS